ncbi:hypothetical protein OPQ81_005023 [Rhizoctonia solani]|nr:hypothetical protein OPQ81_005023 [Rhizoctonia solani]
MACLVLTGVFLDPLTGPVTTTRPVAVIMESGTQKFREINESVTEDVYPQNELDAHYAQFGWPSPNRLPTKPWGSEVLTLRHQRSLGTDIWASRRFMVPMATINLSPEDLRPVQPFVDAVEAALNQETNASQIRALQKVFATWGEMVPLNMVAGACLAVTGTLRDGTALPDGVPVTHPSLGGRPYSLTDILDRHLGTSRSFSRRLESRVQGGSSEILLEDGYDAWLKSVIKNPASWSVVKIHHAVPITDILDDKLQDIIKQLFAGSLMYLSPSVGAPHGFGFEGAANGLRDIEKITIWFSDLRATLSRTCSYGITPMAGLLGFNLSKATMNSLQSMAYEIENQTILTPPVLLSGNGNAQLGISGTYNSDNICQIRAVWRSDVVPRRHRHTQTSFTGSTYGIVFNDIQHLADPSTSRIVQIIARTDGGVANFRTTYLSTTPGGLVRSETPPRGWDTGPLQRMNLEEGEHIIGVRGSHNDQWIHQVQFITNKKEHPPFSADKGHASFSFDAPKTMDGKDMVLHYMAGKS